ncbi:DUF3054 domain-containing protein [Cumulibacter soli]|uniref:DUF3054 domain-containing protein n=1 Tax=Cumulibacter soli TaxID=2546344 RepID=UPI0010687764|nr:DUF3054 domain-containing protein [Cumulibacter soli]
MRAGAAFAIDVVFVIAFAAIGRASHEEGVSVSGIADTAWPFLVGLIVGWAIGTMIVKSYPTTWRTVWPVWIWTVLIGMVLRALTGDGTAVAFIIVATITLGVFLFGWRLIAAAITRRPATKR